MIPSHIQYEFLRPLVQSWTEKAEGARRARQPWGEVAQQCRLFYNQSARAMFDATLAPKFWKMGYGAPKFRMAVNLAYEYVAITLPELMWSIPHRQVSPKLPTTELGPELFGGEDSMMWQIRQQELQAMQTQANAIVTFMDDWLNYTPREMPGGGLQAHSELATIDALLVGRGTQWTRPYSMPGSDKRLTGCFYEPPERLLTDPDYPSIHDGKWVCLVHVEDPTDVERRFGWPEGSLRKHASIESSWGFSELATNSFTSQSVKDGHARTKMVWYEFFSKAGPGCRMTGIEEPIRRALEEAIGDYAYIAIAPGVHSPLNCRAEDLHEGLTTEEVKQKFSWPIPLYEDNRWPVEVLDFYPNTDASDPSAAWPIPPLAPALGEIQALNYLIPWVVNRTHETTRSFWLVAEQYKEKIKKDLQQPDQAVIGVPPMADGDVSKVVSILDQAEMRSDMWRVIELITHMFRFRTGMITEKYGQSATQSRTAEDARHKAEAINLRTEFMQQKVVAYQGQLATTEAQTTQLFVRPQDVEMRYGQTGAMAWGQHISSMSTEQVVRQISYTVSAASIRRPNRERDIANLQEVMQYWIAVLQSYADTSSNYEPINGMLLMWAKLHDMDVSPMLIPPPEPDEVQQQMAERAAQLENEKLQAEAQKLQAEAQAKLIDASTKASQVNDEQGRRQLDLLFDAQKHEQDMTQDAEKHVLDLAQDRQKFLQTLSQASEMGKTKIDLARRSAKQTAQANGKGR